MTRGRPFEPGNTFGRGRPKGSQNKSTSPGHRLLLQSEIQLHLKNIAEGLRTDTKSRHWCLDELAELRRVPPRAAKFKLPPIKTHEDVANAVDVILNAVLNRKLSATDGQAVVAILAEKTKMIETQNLASLEELEARMKKDGIK